MISIAVRNLTLFGILDSGEVRVDWVIPTGQVPEEGNSHLQSMRWSAEWSLHLRWFLTSSYSPHCRPCCRLHVPNSHYSSHSKQGLARANDGSAERLVHTYVMGVEALSNAAWARRLITPVRVGTGTVWFSSTLVTRGASELVEDAEISPAQRHAWSDQTWSLSL